MSLVAAAEPYSRQEELDVRGWVDTLKRRRKTAVGVFLLVFSLGALAAARVDPLYRTTAKVLVQPPAAAKTPPPVDPNNPIGALLVAAQPPSVGAQVDEIMSASSLAEARKAAGIARRPAAGSVKVEAGEGTDVIDITVEGRDPRTVAGLANTIADLHLERTERWQVAALKRTIGFIRRERDQARDSLQDARRRLSAFLEVHPLKQMAVEQEAKSKQSAELQAKIDDARSNIRSTRAQIAQLRGRLEREPLDISRPREQANPQRAQLEEKVRQLWLQRLELLQDFQPTSVQIQAIDEQITSYEQQLKKEPASILVKTFTANPLRELAEPRVVELEAALLQHQANYEAAVAALGSRQGPSPALGPRELQLETLTYERDRAQARYTLLSDRLQDLEIRDTARPQIARVIDRADVPTRPVSPSKTLILLVAATTALLLSIGVALLQDYLDDRVQSPRQAERISALPILGRVPLMSRTDVRTVGALPANSQVSEAYRALRSGIGFAGAGSSLQRLQITSPSQGDGKSVTAVNLALAMAMSGKRVILVDADMRRPSLHRSLPVNQSPGLSEVLAGLCSVDEAIQETDVANLRVLCAGDLPPNPAELLESEAFDNLAARLDEAADVVIFDTPACLPVVDPLLVAARVDGVVLVLHAGRTRKGELLHAQSLLERAHAPVIGTLYNAAQPGNGGYYSHYYSTSPKGGPNAGNGHQNGNGRKRTLPAIFEFQTHENDTDPATPAPANGPRGPEGAAR